MLLASGMRRVDGVEVDEAPVADGGEGTADVLHRSLGGTWHAAAVSDPFGRAISARWLELPDGTAVVGAARGLGGPPVAGGGPDPLLPASRRPGGGLAALVAATPPAPPPRGG